MAKQQHIIYLTDDGVQHLSSTIMSLLWHTNSGETYFVCDKVHQDSMLLSMENIKLPKAKANFQMDIQIPFTTVKFILSGGVTQVLGFVERNLTKNTA